jgi:hypothetical protein
LTAIVTSASYPAPYDTSVRVVVRRGALTAFASALVVFAAPASGVSLRPVTITLYGSGKAFWTLNSRRETSRLLLRYRWRGTLEFAVAAPMLADARHRRLSASTRGTLTASWTGRYRTRKGDAVSTCTYRGTDAAARVSAKLAAGRRRGSVELRLHPLGIAQRFFPDQSRRAVVSCSPGLVQTKPAHFAPSWFFRDSLQDHGRLSSDTAIIVLPGTVLPRGSATVAFPHERGRNDSPALGHLAWDNRAQTAVQAR